MYYKIINKIVFIIVYRIFMDSSFTDLHHFKYIKIILVNTPRKQSAECLKKVKLNITEYDSNVQCKMCRIMEF